MAEKASALTEPRTIGNWINGEVRVAGSDRSLPVYDSATGQQCASVSVSAPADVEQGY